jgi:tetratricopeptide (TPR) repeat protein
MRTAIARAPLIVAALLMAALISACMSKSEKMVYNANEKAKKAQQSDPATREKLLEEVRTELQQAVKLDPKSLDGYKLLAQVDDVLGHTEDAGHDYEAASALDPTDQKLLQKARYYKTVENLVNSAGKAVDQIKQGQVDEGLTQLRDILRATHTSYARDRVVKALQEALPIAVQQGDQAVKDKKYPDAIKTYESAVRGYMLLAEAQGKQTLDPVTDALLHSINEAAKDAGTPDATFRILNDVLTVDPDNKTANMELAQVYLRKSPPDYQTAADLEERAGAPDAEVKKLRAEAKRHRRG